MSNPETSMWQELATPTQFEQLERLAHQRHWGLALVLVGWLHLLAFSVCYTMMVVHYYEVSAYTAVWVAEVLGIGLIFRLCGGPQSSSPPLARFVVRIWFAYLVLAFNLGALNTLRGHQLFELFPAMASLASFGFVVMTFLVSRRFLAAVLVMFASGLLIASHLHHGYLIFGLAWWAVLNAVGFVVRRRRPAFRPAIQAGNSNGLTAPCASVIPLAGRLRSGDDEAAGKRSLDRERLRTTSPAREGRDDEHGNGHP